MTRDIVAVDGPSASGKSTVAKRLALRLGYFYVESGALYRAITWLAIQRRCQDDPAACMRMTDSVVFETYADGNAIRFRLNGTDPAPMLRGSEVNENVSRVSAIPAVRSRVVAWLRQMTAFGNLVVEGRDIGTAVFPDARHKFYLDASPAERARRRHAEESSVSTQKVDVSAVGASLERRDVMDSNRQIDPLRAATDARVIDTTALPLDEVVDRIWNSIADSSRRPGSTEISR